MPRHNRMEHAPTAAVTTGRIPWNPALEGIRGWAVLLVFLFHYLTRADPNRGIQAIPFKIAWAGWIGVDLFFVLSGFLITSILIGSKGSPRYFSEFYGRRVRRIFPLYYGVLFLVFVVLPLVGPLRTPAVRDLLGDQLYFWLYVSNFMPGTGSADWLSLGHFWSLAIEEQFYLVWPAIVFWCDRKRAVRVVIAAMVVSLTSRAILQALAMHEPSLTEARHWAFAWTPCRLDALGAGALIALFSTDSRSRAALDRWARPLGVVAGIMIGWMLWRGKFDDALGAPQGPLHFALAVLVYSILALGFGALVVEATRARTSPLSAFLALRPFRFLGRYSYGIYVFQGLLAPLLGAWLSEQRLAPWFGTGDLAAYAFMTISVVPVLAISVVSWHAYERRFLVSSAAGKEPAHVISAP